jgi:four helix bundle protein
MEKDKNSKMKDQNDNSKSKTDERDTYIRAYKLALRVIGLLRKMKLDQATRIIADQLIRSITSIGANILEAKSASSKRDFTNFFTHALKSANESKFWLGLLRDSKSVDEGLITPYLEETAELARILAASVMTLKGKK